MDGVLSTLVAGLPGTVSPRWYVARKIAPTASALSTRANPRELGATIIALGGVADHVHLLVRLPLTISVAQAVKDIKGSSGHLLARIAMERDTFFKWQGSYGAFSVSFRDLDMIVEYINHQEEHHAQRSLIPDWELPPPEDSRQSR